MFNFVNTQAQIIKYISIYVCSITGLMSYQQSLSNDVDVKGWSAKFSANRDVKEVGKGTNDLHKIYLVTKAKCIQYTASINKGIKVSDVIFDNHPLYIRTPVYRIH